MDDLKRARKAIQGYSLEELAALDIAQQIAAAQTRIDLAEEDLKRLRMAAGRLPEPNWLIVAAVDSYAVYNEVLYRFSSVDPEVEAKLYGFSTEEEV